MCSHKGEIRMEEGEKEMTLRQIQKFYKMIPHFCKVLSKNQNQKQRTISLFFNISSIAMWSSHALAAPIMRFFFFFCFIFLFFLKKKERKRKPSSLICTHYLANGQVKILFSNIIHRMIVGLRVISTNAKISLLKE